MNANSLWPICTARTLLVVVGTAIGVFVLGLVLVWLFNTPISQIFLRHEYLLGNYATHHQLLTRDEVAQLNGFIRRGVIAKPDEVFTALISFYDKIVVLLVALLGVVGAFAYISVRTISRRDAETFADESASRAANAHFQSADFRTTVEEIIESQLASYLPEIQQIQKGMENLALQQEELQSLVERAEAVIAQRDQGEDLSAGTTVAPGNSIDPDGD